MKLKSIHISDAMQLLSDKKDHRVEVWEISTGRLLLYPAARQIGKYQRHGIIRFRLSPSGEIRAAREVTIRSVDDLLVYL